MEVTPGLHIQAEEWDKLYEQLQEEYEGLTSLRERTNDLEGQNIVLGAKRGGRLAQLDEVMLGIL